MTNLQLRTFDIPSISKFSVGFDNILDELMRVNAQQANTNYPPYNVVKHDEDHLTSKLLWLGSVREILLLHKKKTHLLLRVNK